MNNSNDDEKKRAQAMQLFNIAELPVMTFISKFLNEPPNVIFKDDIPKFAEPVILKPIDDYKKGIYLKFTLCDINLNDTNSTDRISFIDKLVEHQEIKDTLGFILYSIKCVFPSVVAASVINNKPLVNINIELDEENWVFYPRYINDQSIKKTFFEESLGKIIAIKNQTDNEVPPDIMADLDKEYANLVESLRDINVTDEILKDDEKINIEFLKKNSIGIFVEEITVDQLPKPNCQPSDLLPVISNKSYEDPR